MINVMTEAVMIDKKIKINDSCVSKTEIDIKSQFTLVNYEAFGIEKEF